MYIYIALGILVCLLLIFLGDYNALQKRRNQIQNAMSSLDALFIKRNDLIPNLVTVVKQYTNYEAQAFEKIVQLRSQKNTAEYQQDGELAQTMRGLMVQVENYPELKASEQYTNLQFSWNEIEEQISAGRRYLSASITHYNNKCCTFPANVVANTFGFKQHEWERATASQKENVNAAELFNK